MTKGVIKIAITKNNEVKVETTGFVGRKCVDATSFIENMGTMKTRRFTQEYNGTPEKVRIEH